jgi:uridine kinase
MITIDMTNTDSPRSALHVLITGAAGSGTSTLADALATAIGGTALEADDFFWLPSDPPYRHKRDARLRAEQLRAALAQQPRLVLAGSIMDWDAAIEDGFDLIVFLHMPTEVRIARLRTREVARFGRADPAFIEWAAAYDEGTAEGRSLARHQAWLQARSGPVLRLTGDLALSDALAQTLAAIDALDAIN